MFSKSKFFKLVFAFLEVIYSGKKRIHEIVNAHTMPIPLVKVSLMGFHVSEGLEIFFLTGGWSKVGKQKFPKNIFLSENDQDALKRRNLK